MAHFNISDIAVSSIINVVYLKAQHMWGAQFATTMLLFLICWYMAVWVSQCVGNTGVRKTPLQNLYCLWSILSSYVDFGICWLLRMLLGQVSRINIYTCSRSIVMDPEDSLLLYISLRLIYVGIYLGHMDLRSSKYYSYL